MMRRRGHDRSLFRALVLGAAILIVCSASHAAKRKTADAVEFTETDLQLELMSYAERYAATIAQVSDDVRQLEPSPEVRLAIDADLLYSAVAAYTIAADVNSQIALLDMVVLATLGKMVFEDYWRPRLGPIADPVIGAFTKLERDVWQVAKPILNEAQQQELRERIVTFRRDNPELSTFSHLRFADFPSRRTSSTLKKTPSGGIFGSVKRVTEQVEQTRLLAERAVYLATRLPLLTGGFADIWVSELAVNPAVEELRQDLHTFAVVADRLATVAEQLPESIATERHDTIEHMVQEAGVLRQEAIEQLLAGVAEERTSAIRQLAAEEERLGGMLTELRLTLTEAGTLTNSVSSLAQRFETEEPAEPAEPFNIEDYRMTLVDARAAVEQLDGLVQSTNQLLNSPGADRLMPGLTDAIDQAGKTSEGLVTYIVIRAAFLILFTLIAYVFARLAYRWLALRVFGDLS